MPAAVINGEDEQHARQRLELWLREEFPHCDAPLEGVISTELDPLPESLTRLNPTLFRATPVCSGSAHGVLTLLSSLDLNALTDLPDAQSVETEQSALDNGLTQLIKHIELRALDSDSTASAILEAHRSLATDTSLRQHLLSGVSRSKLRRPSSPRRTISATRSPVPAAPICRSGCSTCATSATSFYNISMVKRVSRLTAS